MNRRELFGLSAALLATNALADGTMATKALDAVPAGARPPLFLDDDTFWFDTLRSFGTSDYGGSSFAEVAYTSSQITAGDYDSWYLAWNSIADRIAQEADGQLVRGHRVSARDGYLRATNYYFSSDFFLHGTPNDPRIKRAYQRSVSSYRSFIELSELPIEPVEIPYQNTTLPGYLHRPDTSDTPRRTFIIHTGFDGSAENMHFEGARAAVERGYNVLVFDGPGQYGPLHREGLVFRPDWEAVVTPVVDFLVEQRGVDPKRIALMGVSMGGELAPRAAAFEKRLAALIANDGIYDFMAPLLQRVPIGQRDAFLTGLKANEAPQLDAAFASQMKNSPTARWSFSHGTWSTGSSSPREYLAKMLEYNLKDGVAERIACPTLVCDAEDDIFFAGQPQALYDHLTCPKTLMRFTRSQGAGAHCQLGAFRFAYARILDWLDETLA